MPQVALEEALQMALRHHQAGQLGEAEQLYRQILSRQPQNAQALHLLGVLAHQSNRNEQAIEFIQKAIDAQPDFPEAYNNLGLILHRSGQTKAAIAALRRAVELGPKSAFAMANLGDALRADGQIDEAIATCRKAVALKPDHAEAYNNLGNALSDRGQLNEAIAAYSRAIALDQTCAEAHNNLGIALDLRGQCEDAISSYRAALTLRPDYVQAWNNLGAALQEKGDIENAIAAFRKAILHKPDYAAAHRNLGAVLRRVGKVTEATEALRRAIAADPQLVEARKDLIDCLDHRGQHIEAIEAIRKLLEIRPDDAAIHSSLIHALLYDPNADDQVLAAETARWANRHTPAGAGQQLRYENQPNPERRLRIGYLFADPPRHLEAVLAHHDRDRFEVFAYSNVQALDPEIRHMQRHADHWRRIAGRTDEEVCGTIRRDGIDILVEMSGHAPHNRLLVSAQRPAPVQVAYLAPGLDAGIAGIDYRITDAFIDPPKAEHEQGHAEDLIRLPHSLWCYVPPVSQIPTSPLPATQPGHVTFAAIGKLVQMNLASIELWSELLGRLPHSRMLLLILGDGGADEALRGQFASRGVSSSRLQVIGGTSRDQHLALCGQIDIMLDTTPYNGQLTSLDSLWMGVPLVTLRGRTAAGRTGASLLSNLEMNEFIASSTDDYINGARALAMDLPRLDKIRGSLRQQMLESPLLDTRGYTRDLESAFRTIWQRWCGGTPSGLQKRGVTRNLPL